MIRIEIGALGPVAHKISISNICEDLNNIQSVYGFTQTDPISIQSEGRRRDGNRLYYEPDELFSEVHQTRLKRGTSSNLIQVWVTDNEVFEDLFSCVSHDNNDIIISLRTSNISEILMRTRKSFRKYVELELGAQILCARYRTHTGISAHATECAEPWHRDRRNDLFDYYGLHPDNLSKLIQPELDTISKANFKKANVPNSEIEAGLSIVKVAAHDPFSTKVARALEDPYFSLSFGALLGFGASVVSTLDAKQWYYFGLPLLVVMAWRFLVSRNS